MTIENFEDGNTHHAPNAWRDVQRDWESWTIGERVSMAIIALCTFSLLTMIHWFGAA